METRGRQLEGDESVPLVDRQKPWEVKHVVDRCVSMKEMCPLTSHLQVAPSDPDVHIYMRYQSPTRV